MASMYQTFETDPELEQSGVWVEYDSFRVKLARAGGSNKRFARVLEAKTKPYRRAIDTETMSNSVADRLNKEAFSEVLVTGWEVREVDEDGNHKGWKPGIENSDPEGDLLPFTAENVLAVFQHPQMQDLYIDLTKQAQRMALYRRHTLETDQGN